MVPWQVTGPTTGELRDLAEYIKDDPELPTYKPATRAALKVMRKWVWYRLHRRRRKKFPIGNWRT